MSYLEPALPLLLLLGLAGLIGAWRGVAKRSTRLLLTTSICGILILSTNLSAWLVSLPLETWYDKNPIPHESVEAIVVLSGTVYSPTPNRPYPLAAQDTYERLQHALWLFKHWKSLPILVCGGTLDGHEPYAETMSHLLESEGIPPDLIWIEKRSRSTHENAVYGSKILREHGITRIALVVEANSMLRASASFRKLGIIVVPAPIRFTKLDRELTDIIPNWRAIALNGEAIHEIAGLLWYRFRSWI